MDVGLSKNALIDLLARTKLFGGLALEEVELCATRFRPLRFAKGEILFSKGDAGTNLYLLVKGRVRLAVANAEGRELSFRHAVAGDLFGEIAAIDGRPRTAGATALTAVSAYALDQNSFRSLWSTRPAIAIHIVTFLCDRLRETSFQLESIVLHPLDVRLARFLLIALNGHQAPPGRRIGLELGFSQGELATLLGASRSKVNAALGALESAGAIGRTLDRIFCDPIKLEKIARPLEG